MTLFLSQLWGVLHDQRIQVCLICDLLCRSIMKAPSFPDLQHAVHWNEAGDGFIIADVHAFEQQVLPAYYKHK